LLGTDLDLDGEAAAEGVSSKSKKVFFTIKGLPSMQHLWMSMQMLGRSQPLIAARVADAACTS